MPKPILSDSLFNASDVASAILNEADLSTINLNFAVTDRSSLFSTLNSYALHADGAGAFSYNGFMFINFRLFRESGPYDGDCLEISDSNYFPTKVHSFPTISHEGDRANMVKFKTNGKVEMHLPSNSGVDVFYSVINGWYRFA